MRFRLSIPILYRLQGFIMKHSLLVVVFWAAIAMGQESAGMVPTDQTRILQAAGEYQRDAFLKIRTLTDWEQWKKGPIDALRRRHGQWPTLPKEMRIVTTTSTPGDGFIIDNLVYESRPGIWVTANLYRPTKPTTLMPGYIISHSHHTSKTNGELQDMGMTWARNGGIVLVPDHFGHGERRTHPFNTAKDYPEEYRVSRQDYFYRYMTNLQLNVLGDSLMSWLACDLSRGVDVLLKQPGIDPKKIILLGAVAGGGDPAGVTAALDDRIACVVPFNFGGWQPESRVTKNPDREFAWFGDAYWESTRGLTGGIEGGYSHWVIVSSVAPRKVIYAHEFGWKPEDDPAWPRLKRIFELYEKSDHLAFAHGKGSVRSSTPEDTHCTHIGAVHRKMIYPHLERWFNIPIPNEYSKRLPSENLICWTEQAKQELKPKPITAALADIGNKQINTYQAEVKKLSVGQRQSNLITGWLLTQDISLLSNHERLTTPPKVVSQTADRTIIESEPGIRVPLQLLLPEKVTGKVPVVLMVAVEGLAVRDKLTDVIKRFHQQQIAVAIVEVRGTGESRPGKSADRTSQRTTVSQTQQLIGGSVLTRQVSDVLVAFNHLKTLKELDASRVGLWGDSFAPVNTATAKTTIPLEKQSPHIGEPGPALLVRLVGAALKQQCDHLFIHHRGGLVNYRRLLEHPAIWVPHDAIPRLATTYGDLELFDQHSGLMILPGGELINGLNQRVNSKIIPREDVAVEMAKRLLAP